MTHDRQIRAPSVEEARAIADSIMTTELRELARELSRTNRLPYTPSTLVKGIITAIDSSGIPPTVTVNIGGDTTTSVSSVRILNNYSPQVGHTVLIQKQGPQVVVVGRIAGLSAYQVTGGAGGWNKATLSNGSHNGGSEGDVYYRRILDHGSWKMQWRGGWTTGGGTAMISAGQALASEFRPTGPRTVVAARDTSGSALIAFATDGTVTTSAATWVGFNGVEYFL